MEKDFCYVTFCDKFIKNMEKQCRELREQLNESDNNNRPTENRNLEILGVIRKYLCEKNDVETGIKEDRTLEISEEDLEWLTDELVEEVEKLSINISVKRKRKVVRVNLHGLNYGFITEFWSYMIKGLNFSPRIVHNLYLVLPPELLSEFCKIGSFGI